MFESHPMNPKVFDDSAKNQNNAPKNLPTEPDDMLAGVDKVVSPVLAESPNALKSGLLKPREAATVLPNPDYMPPPKPETITVETKKTKGVGIAGMVKVVMIILFVFLLAGLGYAGWVVYGKYNEATKAAKTETPKFEATNENNSQNTVANNSNTEASSTEQQAVVTPAPVVDNTDTDNDGLTDAEEKQLGTNPSSADTDGDKLSDLDEVRVWMTDPLKADTDGDGYQDGSEILNGFNPKGPGKFTPTLPVVRFVSSTGSLPTEYTYSNNPIVAK